MSEFKDQFEKKSSEKEGEKEISTKLKMAIDDLVMKVNGYAPEKLEYVVNNLGFTIEGDKYEGLIGIIKGSTNMSEAETLAAMIRTAEEELDKKEKND